jgi:hypothetical protein
MTLSKLKWAGAALLLSGVALTGAGVMARQAAQKRPNNPPSDLPPPAVYPPAEPRIPPETAQEEVRAVPDLEAKRTNLLKAAQVAWATALGEYRKNGYGVEQAYQASKRLKDAEEQSAGPSRHEQSAPTRSHFDRIRELARIQSQNARSSDLEKAQVKSLASEAELWLALALERESQAHEEPASVGEEPGPKASAGRAEGRAPAEETGPGDGRGKDAKSRRILSKLEEPISMSFAEETPLEDVLKYIKQATTTPTYNGIPIYVDPLGLIEAEKTMQSTVHGLDLEGVPLRRTLQLLLKQIDLIYFVEDGMLFITSQDADSTLGPTMPEPSPLMEQVDKAERGELTVGEMQKLVELLKTREEVMKLAKGKHGLR